MWLNYLLILAVLLQTYSQFRYDNYSLYKITPKTTNQLIVLKNISKEGRLDFWTEPRAIDMFVSVMVAPSERASLTNVLVANNITYSITLENIQSEIETQKVCPDNEDKINLTWDSYYKLEDIEAWMARLIEDNPNKVSPVIGGVTVEGRNIKGLKISHGDSNDKRAVFIEGGLHAREWISPATVTYIINELLTSDDLETRQYAEEFDWFLFPITNPDGYKWTFDSDRLWRKNRKMLPNAECGVDLNRNWDVYWMNIGASNDTSDNMYGGARAFSEPETRSLANFITSIAKKIDLYISFHSFSQLIMIPFGHSPEHLENYNDAKAIGLKAAEALSQRFGTDYTVGNIYESIYGASGTSIDWVKLHLKVPLCYLYELRDKGEHGFLLPNEQILPTCKETMDSILALIRSARSFGYMLPNDHESEVN